MGSAFATGIAIVLVCLCLETGADRIIRTVQTKETESIRNKLATAEGKVSDLISRLDSVSDDASRAKTEIHSTLTEVWKIVDMLGQDRCGEVVDKVRVAQKKAESKVSELEEEIRIHLKDIESLKLQLVKQDESAGNLQTEIRAERSRREALEGEARELRDKLHWASAVSNETQKYELVAERVQNLLVVVSERTQLLNRILTMVGDAHSGFSEWTKEIDSLSTIVRDAQRDFSGGYQSAAMDGLQRQSSELERRLQDALRGRDLLADEKNTLKKSIQTLQNKLVGSSLGSSKGRDRIIIKSDEGSSVIGIITLCIVSLCSGAVGVYLIGLWQQSGSSANAGEPDKYGFTPTSARTSPGFQSSNAGASPLQFAGPGSASRTPGSRGSTPRRY